MARKYKRKVGSRNYKTTYTEETIFAALREVQRGSLSIRKASQQYKIPFGTLRNKIKKCHTKIAGGQKRLSNECEGQIVKTIDVLTEWKVPLSGFDISYLSLLNHIWTDVVLPIHVLGKIYQVQIGCTTLLSGTILHKELVTMSKAAEQK